MTVVSARKLPLEVEVVRWTGDNWDEVLDFGLGVRVAPTPPYLSTGATLSCGCWLAAAGGGTLGALARCCTHDRIVEVVRTNVVEPVPADWDFMPLQLLAGKDGATGWVEVPDGSYIARTPNCSDYWPIDPETFSLTYEVLVP